MAPAGRREGCCSTDDGGCDHTLNDQVAALQAHVDQLKKEKDALMDDKDEATELVEWAERKLEEATERIDIRRLYAGTIVPALSCTPLGPRFAELLAKAPEGPTRAAACERELGGIWRAADWRRHVLETRRRRGHALGKRPSLRALSWAASLPLVSLVCPPARPLPKHKTCAPSPAVPGARWPRPLSSCGPPSPVRGAPPKCSNGVGAPRCCGVGSACAACFAGVWALKQQLWASLPKSISDEEHSLM